MNKLIITILFSAATGAVFAQNKASKVAPVTAPVRKSIAIGAEIPLAGVMLQSADGKPTSLQQEKTDKGLIVMFSCNTCPYVIKAQQRTQDVMHQANSLKVGMVVVNSNEAQRQGDDAVLRMREYANMHGYSAPYVIDEQSQLANAFGASRTPEVFLFDGKGKLVYKGALEDNPAEPEKSKQIYMLNAMQALNEGRKIQPEETKSIGCSIKRADL